MSTLRQIVSIMAPGYAFLMPLPNLWVRKGYWIVFVNFYCDLPAVWGREIALEARGAACLGNSGVHFELERIFGS
jgi:hypothetical protein